MCDLSAVVNNPKRLSLAQSWLSDLAKKQQFGLFSLSHDSMQPISELLGKNAIVLRTSMQSSIKYKNEFLMPVFLEEDEFKDWTVITELQKPSVGFVGHSVPNLHHEMITKRSEVSINKYGYVQTDGSELLRNPINIGLIIRNKALKTLGSTKEISTNFVQKDKHFFGTENSKSQERNEYISNLDSNIYSLCIRGAGNYSIRFYETLAKGRIPILIDTDLVFPIFTSIDWKAFTLTINLSEIDSIHEKILEFHSNLNKAKLIQTQILARNVWYHFLRRDPYFNLMIPFMMSCKFLDE